MSLLRSLVVSLSLFSRIPMPRLEWTERSTRWAMAFLPVVGLLIGAVLVLWHVIAGFLSLNIFVYGAGIALLPLLVTGSIHMDGFCDTVDALASNGDIETRQRILKDSSTGAFAVMGAAAYLLAFAAFGSELAASWTLLLSFCCVFVFSRSLGGLAMMWFPTARTSGIAHTFAQGSQKTPTVVILLFIALFSAGAVIWLGGIPGAVAVLCSLAVFGVLRFWLIGMFGGLSGDLVGWCIQMCELCALIGLVIAHRVMLVL